MVRKIPNVSSPLFGSMLWESRLSGSRTRTTSPRNTRKHPEHPSKAIFLATTDNAIYHSICLDFSWWRFPHVQLPQAWDRTVSLDEDEIVAPNNWSSILFLVGGMV